MFVDGGLHGVLHHLEDHVVDVRGNLDYVLIWKGNKNDIFFSMALYLPILSLSLTHTQIFSLYHTISVNNLNTCETLTLSVGSFVF